MAGPSPHASLEVEAPVLVAFVEATYPEAARAARLEATVTLTLMLDVEGNVVEAAVLEAEGHGFDEAALAAVRQFRFRPARRGGVPVAAKIRYAYEFRLPPAPPSPPGEAPALAPTLAPTEAPPAAAATTPERPPLEVVVKDQTPGDKLRRSAQAVTVIETRQAKRESSDLGQVIGKAVGVRVQRSGGLGSQARISLYGLTDDQIRFFENEVPLDFMGFGQGAANVPLNLVERVEIYRGVVPIRFGADALGGAVNLVTEGDERRTSAAASYQVGSYGIYRATLGGEQLFRNGLFVGANAFVDHAKNDYSVDVLVPDQRGRLTSLRARRFHDGYSAKGANLSAGVVDQPWAKKLVLKVFTTDYTKQLQHNVNMTVPYGEVEFGESVYGSTLRYEKRGLFTRGLSVNALLGYSHRTIEFHDTSPWVYDWSGHRVFERRPGSRPPGELTGKAIDSVVRENRGIGRLGVGYRINAEHALRLVASSFLTSRKGQDRLWSSELLDPLAVRQRTTTVVSGLEYEAHVLDRRLENIAFVKDYRFAASAEQVVTTTNTLNDVSGEPRHAFGFGDALRFRVVEGLWLKASYENATRLPRPDELFGNGSTIIKNLDIAPERSKNSNIGVALDVKQTPAGALRAELNGFVRSVSDLILLVPAFDPTYAQYINIAAVQSTGVDASAGWTFPEEYLSLDGNFTWFDLENRSTAGPYARFEGERVPNRPWFTVNGYARFRLRELAAKNDEGWLSWSTQYVGPFFTGWESAGRQDMKTRLPSQLLHGCALGYLVRGALTTTATFEVQNLTDEKVYDVLGVQKMGRAFFFKGTVEL